MLFLWFALILTIEEKWLSIYNKSPRLYPDFYPCPIALWASLQLENTSTIAMNNTDWKSLQIYNPFYIFMDLERLLNWLKKIKITKSEENLSVTVKHCSK